VPGEKQARRPVKDWVRPYRALLLRRRCCPGRKWVTIPLYLGLRMRCTVDETNVYGRDAFSGTKRNRL